MNTSIGQRVMAMYGLADRGDRQGLLAQIDELYTKDILAISPINTRYGITVFKAFWSVTFDIYQHLRITGLTLIENEEQFSLFYTMSFKLAEAMPAVNMPVATIYRTRDDGDGRRVYWQQDYWDTLGAFCRVSPELYVVYTNFMASWLSDGTGYEQDPGLPPVIMDDGCYHPASEAEITGLIRATRERGGIRVAGSGHSVWEAIAPATILSGDSSVKLLVLDRYRSLTLPSTIPQDATKISVTVQAGCYLGASPRLPLKTAITAGDDFFIPDVNSLDLARLGPDETALPIGSLEASLCYQLDQVGFALPDLGGITHQSVGGFLSTGSAGGTCKYSLLDSIEAIRIIDGQGKAHDLTPNEEPDAFAAAGISLGLCGVLSTVTFSCIPRFDIQGSETTGPACDHPKVDFYNLGTGKPSLSQYLEQTDYARMMWWPQKDFDRLVVWEASRATPPVPPNERKPYVEMNATEQLAASFMFTLLGSLGVGPEHHEQTVDEVARTLGDVRRLHGHSASAKALNWDHVSPVRLNQVTSQHAALPQELEELIKKVWTELSADLQSSQAPAGGPMWFQVIVVALEKWVQGELLSNEHLSAILQVLRALIPYFIGDILGIFIKDSSASNPAQQFRDIWYNGIPMDNGVSDLLVPTWFTEIWIPFSNQGVDKTIAALRELFSSESYADAYAHTGPYCIELYATAGNERFFLNPAYGNVSCIRVDVFWFGRNVGDPRDFFKQFWEKLAPLSYRLHWGKFLPHPAQQTAHDIPAGYPRWEQFKKVQKELDPNGIFVTDYWNDLLKLLPTP